MPRVPQERQVGNFLLRPHALFSRKTASTRQQDAPLLRCRHAPSVVMRHHAAWLLALFLTVVDIRVASCQSLPAECLTSLRITEAYRDIFSPGGTNCDGGLVPGWYRLFQGSTPAFLPEGYPTSPAGDYYHQHCGCDRTVALNQYTYSSDTGLPPSAFSWHAGHPAVSEGIVNYTLYAEYGARGTAVNISARHCGAYFVYYLTNQKLSWQWGGAVAGNMCQGMFADTTYFGYCTTTVAPAVGLCTWPCTASPTPPPSPLVTTFTAVGVSTFTVTAAAVATVLVVAGGGAGGAFAGGGGGGGGVLLFPNVSLAPGNYSVTVGAGGLPVSGCGMSSTMYHMSVSDNAGRGGSSSFGSLTPALGGGRGACGGNRGDAQATSGGSGGGAGSSDPSGYPGVLTGGAGTPGQGFPGGNAAYGSNSLSSPGGGGANGTGGNSLPDGTPGQGGNGLLINIPGAVSSFYGGGGGGAAIWGVNAAQQSLGGGGVGASYDAGGGTVTGGSAGAPNTGGGGGGGGVACCSGVGSGFAGGSGIVIVVLQSGTSALSPPLTSLPVQPSPPPPPPPWPARYACADITDLQPAQCAALAAMVIALPGLASSSYTQFNSDQPSTTTSSYSGGTMTITSYIAGLPWFSTTTACGLNADNMTDSWTGLMGCSGSSSSSSFSGTWRVTKLWISQQSSGVFPPSVFSLSYLTELQIYSNSGMRGFIPDAFGSLQALTFLALGGNTALSGAIPPSIGSLPSLTTLYLSTKRAGVATPFTGLVPASLCNLQFPGTSYCSIPSTVTCPLPSCATVSACSSGCVTPSPPPPSSSWTAVAASVTLGGYTATTLTTALQTAFIAVTAGILGKPASSVAITSIATASAARRAVLDVAVLVQISVTATSATDASAASASLSSLSTTQRGAFVMALQAGGLSSTTSAAVAVLLPPPAVQLPPPAVSPPPPATTSHFSPPPSGGGGGNNYPGQYYGPTPFPNSYTPSSQATSSGAGTGIAVGIIVPLVLSGFAVCRIIARRRAAAAARQAAAPAAVMQMQPQRVQQMPQVQPQQVQQMNANPLYGGGSATPTRAANNSIDRGASIWFHSIDSDHDGFITGEEARQFFMESLLPPEQLAQIWASFPKRRPGCLDVQEFAHMFETVKLAKSSAMKRDHNPFEA